MSGKSLILIGLGASALYTYFCISTHKDQLYKKLYHVAVSTNTNSVPKEEPIHQAQEIVEKTKPSFSFINSEPYKFNAILEKDAQHSEIIQHITQICQDKPCENDIQFLENVKKESWSNKSQTLISYLIDNQIQNGSITIKDNKIDITGELKDTVEQEKLNELLTTFDSSYQIQNKTTIAEILIIEEPAVEIPIEEEPVIQEQTNEEEQVLVAPKELTEEEAIAQAISTIKTSEITIKSPTEEISIEEDSIDTTKIETAQSEINILLENSVINFQLNSSKILPSSQKVLDNIIQIINDLSIELKLNIAGHTDASGSAGYNKNLSQQRASSVKKYLIKKGIHAQELTATGYGEEKLIFAPNDKKNRRVEITLKKGE